MNRIYEYNSIKNVKSLDDHKKYLKTKFDRDTTRNNHITYVDLMLRKIGKDFDKLNIKDIESYLDGIKESSAETYKPAIRLFLKKNGRKKLADMIERNAKVLNRCQKYDDKDIIKKEKIDELINKPDLLMHRAILETFLLYGIREDELIQLRKSDIKIDKLTVWVNVRFPKGRLKKRKIPIFPNDENPVAKYPINLVNCYRSLTNRKDDDYLFYSRQYNNRGGKLSASGLRSLVNGYGKDVGIDRLCPHLLRHTGATYDGEFYNPQDMCLKYGWKLNSTMLNRYCHYNEKQLLNNQIRNAKKKIDDIEEGRKCPNCETINNYNEKYCIKCKYILDTKELMKEVKQNISLKDKVNNLENKFEKVIDLLEKERLQWIDGDYYTKNDIAKGEDGKNIEWFLIKKK